MSKQLNQFNKIHKEYSEKFKSSIYSLHNLLWQILINKNFEGRSVAFTPVIRQGETQIGISEKGKPGFIASMVAFIDGDYKKASDICFEMNKKVFGVDEDTATEIILSSMGKSKTSK